MALQLRFCTVTFNLINTYYFASIFWKGKSMKVRLHLLSKENNTIHVDIFPNKTSIAKKWFAALEDILKANLALEKNFCWVGFPNTPRQLPYLCNLLNYYIEVINSYSKSGGWESAYFIEEKYFPETVEQNGELNQPLMNSIHHHFEILQGQVWNISPWFLEANDDVRYAIRQINNLCHEIEILVKAKQTYSLDHERVSPASIMSFLNAPRFELAKEDYEHFTLDRGIGKVFMHYCQTGKIHWEAFVDNDAKIDRSNINGLRYYSGEFNIEWGPTYNDGFDWWVAKKESYKSWLLKNDYNPDDKFLSHGWLEIGHVDLEPLYAMAGSRKVSGVQKILSDYLDVAKIEAISETGSVAFDYPTKWSAEHFHSAQQEKLAESYQSFCQNTVAAKSK